MNMKKHTDNKVFYKNKEMKYSYIQYLLFVLLFGCFAQQLSATESDKPLRDGIDPLYIQIFGGINKSANEHLPWTEFSGYPWSGGTFLAVGSEATPLWGWRAALRYNHNKGRNVEKCESDETWGWHSISLFADATFDITDALTSKASRGKNPFNMKAFAGIGAAYTFGFDNVPLSYTDAYSRNNRAVPAFRLGINASWRLSDRWRIGTELSQTMFADRFNGVKSDFCMDGRTNLKVGFTYLLGKKNTTVRANAPVIYDNRLRYVPSLPFAMPEEETTKRRNVSGRAFLDFPVNETTIYPKYRRNPQELQRICTTIDNALFDKTIQVTSISLHGYASPESPYSNNTRLAKGRTAALMNYLKGKYGISTSLFHNSYTPEDWQNLHGFIATEGRRRVKGDIWYDDASILETPEAPNYVVAQRDELLRIIDLNIDADEKEDMLKKVDGGEPYRWLLQNVYPGLRHTDYIIEYVVRSYPVKEARKLIYTHPEALSVEEMYKVAQSYKEGTDDWLDALLIAAKQYPDDHTANLNAACACVKTKRQTDAKRFLKNAGNSEQAKYVADVIKAMEGKCQWQMVDGKVVVDGE